MNNTTKKFAAVVTIFLSLLSIIFVFIKIKNISQTRKSYYKAGLDHLKQGDCQDANKAFNLLLEYGLFLNKRDGLSDKVKKHQTECSVWQNTQKEVKNAIAGQQFSQALIIYYDFVNSNPTSLLVKPARQNARTLFNDVPTIKLATNKSCPKIDSFVDRQLVPDLDANLPDFYFSCIRVYQKEKNSKEEFEFQYKFLKAYPNHDRTLTVKQNILKNPLVCNNSDRLQKSSAAVKWGNLLPVVYLSCGRAYQKVIDYPTAITFYNAVLNSHSDLDLTKKARKYLTDTDREIAKIQAEMARSAETIKGRITACTAGSIFFDWAIDIGELISGRDCMTGESLHDIERFLTIVPLVDGIKGAAKVSRAWQLIDTVATFAAINRTQNLLQEHQSFFQLLADREEVELLAAHNANLIPLISNRGKSINLSQHHKELAELLE